MLYAPYASLQKKSKIDFEKACGRFEWDILLNSLMPMGLSPKFCIFVQILLGNVRARVTLTYLLVTGFPKILLPLSCMLQQQTEQSWMVGSR